jgi:hypothetical protein
MKMSVFAPMQREITKLVCSLHVAAKDWLERKGSISKGTGYFGSGSVSANVAQLGQR